MTNKECLPTVPCLPIKEIFLWRLRPQQPLFKMTEVFPYFLKDTMTHSLFVSDEIYAVLYPLNNTYVLSKSKKCLF